MRSRRVLMRFGIRSARTRFAHSNVSRPWRWCGTTTHSRDIRCSCWQTPRIVVGRKLPYAPPWKAGRPLERIELSARPPFSTPLYGMIDSDSIGPRAIEDAANIGGRNPDAAARCYRSAAQPRHFTHRRAERPHESPRPWTTGRNAHRSEGGSGANPGGSRRA